MKCRHWSISLQKVVYTIYLLLCSKSHSPNRSIRVAKEHTARITVIKNYTFKDSSSVMRYFIIFRSQIIERFAPFSTRTSHRIETPDNRVTGPARQADSRRRLVPASYFAAERNARFGRLVAIPHSMVPHSAQSAKPRGQTRWTGSSAGQSPRIGCAFAFGRRRNKHDETDLAVTRRRHA